MARKQIESQTLAWSAKMLRSIHAAVQTKEGFLLKVVLFVIAFYFWQGP